MTNYQWKKFKLSDTNIEYIQELKELKELPDDSTALRTILNEHREFKMQRFDLNFIVASLKNELIIEVSKFISSDVLEEIRRVRLGTNNTDRNTQILIELMASWMQQSNIETIFSTDKYKPDFLTFAEATVGARITHKKQKKDDKLNLKGANNHVDISS